MLLYRGLFTEDSADLILEVVDASDVNHSMHSQVTDRTLSQLGAGAIPRITVMNKADKIEIFTIPEVRGDKIYMSAKSGVGIEELIELIEKKLSETLSLCRMVIPYEKSGIESQLRSTSQVTRQDRDVGPSGREQRPCALPRLLPRRGRTLPCHPA